MDYSNNVFNQLKALPRQGIYYLINQVDRKVYINYSSNIPNAIVKLLSDSNFGDGYYFNVLEIVTDKKNLRIRCQYFKDLYSNMNYNLINNKRVSNRKIVIKLLPDFRGHIDGMCFFYIKIVSKGYGELTVGVFKHITEVDSFMSQNYSNGFNNIIYADNDLTKEYLKK